MPPETDRPPSGTYPEAKIILIVEDDEDIGPFIVQALQQATPYHPIWVADGFAALKTVHDLKPDLLILDYQLPNMDGIELYDQLHARPELMSVPALLMSAQRGLPHHALEKRKLKGISKPIELSEFLETIDRLLAEGSK